MKRREDLTTPRAAGRVGVSYDADVFGRFSESIANFLGTARFLVWQTVVITVWILLNSQGIVSHVSHVKVFRLKRVNTFDTIFAVFRGIR